MLEFAYAAVFVLAYQMLSMRQAETEDGTKMFFANPFKSPKKVNQNEIIAAQESAAKKEKERLMTEQAIQEADAQSKAQGAAAKVEAKRRAFASGAMEADEEEENARRKFLKGV